MGDLYKTLKIMAKIVKQTETISSLKKELLAEKDNYKVALGMYNDLLKEANQLKESFRMVKNNFEREKNRLDKTIESLLNISCTIKKD